jgi:hypothetical protein
MSDGLPTGRQNPQPSRAKDNSPRIHPWVADRVGNKSRQGRKRASGLSHAFFRPSGAWEDLGARCPSDESLGYFRVSLRGQTQREAVTDARVSALFNERCSEVAEQPRARWECGREAA